MAPLCPSPSTPPSAPIPPPEANENRALSPKTFRVLVVDDLPSIHEDIRRVLAPRKPVTAFVESEEFLFGTKSRAPRVEITFEIDSAMQGDEGIERVRQAVAAQRPYALAFVDMRMPPGKDGLQTMLEMWEIDPDLQVVSCSAYSDYSWDQMIAAIGDTDQLLVLRKPFDPVEVVQITHALTKKWELHCAARRQLQSLRAEVTERTRELHDRQALFELILENAADLIAVVDPEGRRIYNSPSYQTVLGYDAAAPQNTDAFAQIHPEDLPTIKAAIERARATSRGDTITYRMRHADGTWRTLESRAGVVRDAAGSLSYFVMVARDVTERREDELKQQLGQKLESIGRLAAGIAHEINTPTQFITDNTRFLRDAFQTLAATVQSYRVWRETLASDPATAARAQALAAAENIADLDFALTESPKAIAQSLEGLARVARIVQSLKDFSHPGTPAKSPIDLNRAIETAVTVSRHEWRYVAELETDLDRTLPLVPCVSDEFNQVVLNLLVNAAHTIADALKARNETRGTITVRTRRTGEHAVVEVSDTGMGIPTELHSRIFEPFFTTKEVGKGTGQGLAIVHAVVVKHHGGTVDFTTEPGKGTTFRLSLPLQ